MWTLVTVQQLAQLSDIGRECGSTNEFPYRKGSRVGKLTHVEWARLPSGRPTRREIVCFDNGATVCYDKNYEVELETVTIVDRDGTRWSVPAELFFSNGVSAHLGQRS